MESGAFHAIVLFGIVIPVCTQSFHDVEDYRVDFRGYTDCQQLLQDAMQVLFIAWKFFFFLCYTFPAIINVMV